MPKKKSYLTVTDQFCGAGGSSQGVRRLAKKYKGGLDLKLALNHWALAIETHNTNFPDTFHDCTDISACDPRRYLSTDILITSPECTTHSPAGGNNHKALKKQMEMFAANKIDPATERSRATMWDVCRFAEYHKYNCIIVENVVEAKTRWVLFDDWLRCMHKLGYDHRCVYINSMHCHPTPQSRDRMYIVFWRSGNKPPLLDYNPVAYCPKCGKNVNAVQTWKNYDAQFGKYRQQYVYCCSTCTSIIEPYYYAAFNCIDWSDIGIKISERARPLSPNTTKRIEYGLNKYGKQPFIIQRSFGKEARGVTRSTEAPCFTQTSTESQAVINHPFIVNDQHSSGIGFRVKSTTDHLPTMLATHQLKLLTPPFVLQCDQGTNLKSVRGVNEELQTQLQRQSMALVAPPLIVRNYSPGYTKPASESLGAVTCQDHHGLVCPPFLTEMYGGGTSRSIMDVVNTATAKGIKTGLVTSEAWNSFITAYNGGSHCTKHISEEMGTQTANERNSVVTYQEPKIEDCFYRMLKPKEIKLAMAFDPDYIILGSGKNQVKQLGNAVTPPVMEWLVERCVESLC